MARRVSKRRSKTKRIDFEEFLKKYELVPFFLLPQLQRKYELELARSLEKIYSKKEIPKDKKRKKRKYPYGWAEVAALLAIPKKAI